MDKIRCSQNRPIVFDTNVIKIIWLTWLFEMTKMTKAISWCGITNFIFKLKIKLFIWIYNGIMELCFGTIGKSKTLPPLTWDSTLKKINSGWHYY